MMTAEDLKYSILQLAMSGKLVEQKPEEGIGEGLYKKMQADKSRLISEHKIKKDKPLAEVKIEELPFEVPQNWKAVRVGEIGSWSAGATPSRSHPEYYGGNIPWLKTGDLNDGDICEVPEFITEEGLQHSSVRLNPVGSVLMAMYGATIGKLGILKIEATTNQACCACICYEGMWNKYLFYYLLSQRKNYIAMGAGGAQPNISKDKIVNSIIAIPPLAEQKRIVAKIEELMPLVEQYAAASTKLNTLNATFPEMMKKSILQEAVQGKLVPQDPNDEPASLLLKKIAEEKKRLIKEGKIKKQKPLPEITEDEIPFDIPESWEWVRLGSLCDTVTGRLDANAQDPKGKYPFFTCGEEVYKTIDYSFDCDAILLGGNNAAGIYKMHRYCGKFNAYQRVYVISGRSKYELDYLYCVIKYWLPYLRTNSQGTTTRFIKLGQVTNMLVPMPPINEQIRILEKLSRIIPLLSVSRTKDKACNSLYYPAGLTEL